jgi:phospholipid/cholesterol/gamma-HCH transport system permease protein
MSNALSPPADSLFHIIGRYVIDTVRLIGDVTVFGLQMLGWLLVGIPRGQAFWSVMYQVGVQSVSVVCITGGFIGMVLAIQAYDQFAMMHMENQLGTVVNVTLVKELGPVLAAVMLAGRVGSAIAAELGTMRVTEQIDALTALGANPIRNLVVPRFVACVVLIPMLTVVADCVGILTGWLFSTQALGVDSFFYWYHSKRYVAPYDIISGLIKSLFFGAAISLIACHRGFNSSAGAEGVGRAATESFVYSFVVILAMDFVLGTFFMELYYLLWPRIGAAA